MDHYLEIPRGVAVEICSEVKIADKIRDIQERISTYLQFEPRGLFFYLLLISRKTINYESSWCQLSLYRSAASLAQ